MLRQIVALWKGESFIKKVVGEFGEMLSDTEYLFTHAWEALIGEAVIDQIPQPFYDKDIAVNSREREIRRMLVQHLSIYSKPDIPGCLAMMSLVKDAERIGVLNRLVTADELEKETLELAAKIANGPPVAIRETKRRVYEGLESDFETALQSADEGEFVTVATEDYKEGVRAFLEKRPPEFKGR